MGERKEAKSNYKEKGKEEDDAFQQRKKVAETMGGFHSHQKHNNPKKKTR